MLLREGHRAGLLPEQFWELTLREVLDVIEASTWRQIQRYKAGLFVAWQIETFARTKRLPDLENLLSRLDEHASGEGEDLKEQPIEEQLAVMHMWRSALGAKD